MTTRLSLKQSLVPGTDLNAATVELLKHEFFLSPEVMARATVRGWIIHPIQILDILDYGLLRKELPSRVASIVLIPNSEFILGRSNRIAMASREKDGIVYVLFKPWMDNRVSMCKMDDTSYGRTV